MSRLVLALCLSVSSVFAFAADKPVTSIEDKKTLMGTIEFPLDVAQTEAIEIGKFLKKEMKFDQVIVRQISGRRYGIEIQTKYEGGEKAVDSILEKSKSLVTAKFGKNTIAAWSMSGTVYVIQ